MQTSFCLWINCELCRGRHMSPRWIVVTLIVLNSSREILLASDRDDRPPTAQAQSTQIQKRWILNRGRELLVENILVVDHPQRERRVIICTGRDPSVPCDPISSEQRILFLDEAALAMHAEVPNAS